VSTVTDLPVGVANSSILIHGTEVTQGQMVLFRALAANAGVYQYNLESGLFAKYTPLVPWGLVYAPTGTWRLFNDGWATI
jgi:hypothetical protein